ncbi:MAG: hypothetical protein OXE99_05085 [Cellvibrionales bacterium]|nr:hypothetical protein [Cellvibrionales bacterium]
MKSYLRHIVALETSIALMFLVCLIHLASSSVEARALKSNNGDPRVLAASIGSFIVGFAGTIFTFKALQKKENPSGAYCSQNNNAFDSSNDSEVSFDMPKVADPIPSKSSAASPKDDIMPSVDGVLNAATPPKTQEETSHADENGVNDVQKPFSRDNSNPFDTSLNTKSWNIFDRTSDNPSTQGKKTPSIWNIMDDTNKPRPQQKPKSSMPSIWNIMRDTKKPRLQQKPKSSTPQVKDVSIVTFNDSSDHLRKNIGLPAGGSKPKPTKTKETKETKEVENFALTSFPSFDKNLQTSSGSDSSGNLSAINYIKRLFRQNNIFRERQDSKKVTYSKNTDAVSISY